MPKLVVCFLYSPEQTVLRRKKPLFSTAASSYPCGQVNVTDQAERHGTHVCAASVFRKSPARLCHDEGLRHSRVGKHGRYAVVSTYWPTSNLEHFILERMQQLGSFIGFVPGLRSRLTLEVTLRLIELHVLKDGETRPRRTPYASSI